MGDEIKEKEGTEKEGQPGKEAEKVFYPPEDDPSKKTDETEKGKEKEPESEPDKKPESKPDDVKKSEEDWDAGSLKLPEKSELKESDQKEVAAFAKENKLTKESAQKLLDRESARLNSFLESMESDHEKTVKGWEEEVRKDSEVGGSKFDESVKRAQGVIDKYSPEGMNEWLKETGFGSHPLLIKTLNRIGKAMADDTLVKGSTNPVKEEMSMADAFYSKE